MLYPLKQNYLPSVSKTIYRCGNVCSLYLRLYEYVPLCFQPNLTNANFFLPSMTIYYQNTVFISWENRVNKRTTNSIVRCTRMLSSSICIRVMLWYIHKAQILLYATTIWPTRYRSRNKEMIILEWAFNDPFRS